MTSILPWNLSYRLTGECRWLPILLLILTLSGCSQNSLKMTLENITPIGHISSASGLVQLGQTIYIIGDDTPFLYSLDHHLQPKSELPIYSTSSMTGTKIPKAIKPDFEAMEALNDNEILVFGSGSLSPQRDILIHINLKHPDPVYAQYSLTEFYNTLKKMPQMEGVELNIEGLAISDTQLFLFNRSNNLIFSFPKNGVLDYLMSEGPFIQPQIYTYQLPEIGGIQSKFSGATYLPEASSLLFTSSVEDTDNAYDDGAVLGSFIGKIIVEEDGLSPFFEQAQVTSEGKPLKVESITVEEVLENGKVKVICCTDSDGGTSVLLRATLSW